MKQEYKDLLLKDLCARLPYHPIVSVAYNYADKGIVWGFDVLRIKLLLEIEEEENWEYIKPYLRPMSSMTKDEKSKFYDICTTLAEDKCHFIMEGFIDSNFMLEKFSYLDSIHVDYRGLIDMGLAIEVTKENNPYKEIKL